MRKNRGYKALSAGESVELLINEYRISVWDDENTPQCLTVDAVQPIC